MIVCSCYAVSDHDIKYLVREGHQTLNSLQRRCKVGEGCGSCLCEVRELLAKHAGVEPTTHQPPVAFYPSAC